MARDTQSHLDMHLFEELSNYDGAIRLRDTMLRERAAESLPRGLLRREDQRSRSIDVESMNHTASQTTLADAVYLGVEVRNRVEHSRALRGVERMDSAARRLRDCAPALAFGEHVQLRR